MKLQKVEKYGKIDCKKMSFSSFFFQSRKGKGFIRSRNEFIIAVVQLNENIFNNMQETVVIIISMSLEVGERITSEVVKH